MLIVIGFCHCNDLPSGTEVQSSINRTIDEVERLIRQNATLPQLTREEIIDILFNITSKELGTEQSKKPIETARNIYQKALMVVLPYNAKDTRENIRDLYTKPPIVELITEPSFDRENSVLDAQLDKQSAENFVTYTREKNFPEESPPAETQYKNHRETYSEAHSNESVKEILKSDSAPIKFSFNLENLGRKPIFTEEPTITARPVYQATPSTKSEQVYVVYSTSATTISPETREIKKNLTALDLGIDMISKHNASVLSVDQWQYNAPTTQSTTTLTKLSDMLFKQFRDKQSTTLSNNLAPTMSIGKVNYTPEISKVTAASDKIPVNTEPSAPIYVTPVPSSSSFPLSSEKTNKHNSTYNLNSGGFRRITTTMPSKVMELLASIGLRPENATNVEDVFKRNEDLETKSEIFNSNGLIPGTSGLTDVAPNSPSIGAQNTFVNPVSEIGKGMNNLTPDVQLLFQRFGLQTSNLATTTMSTLKSTINTNSYTNFKPLPTSNIRNDDMREFLAKFGLGVSDSRRKKAMPAPTTERPSLIEAVPDSMRQILENIGLISRKVSRTTPKMESAPPTKPTKIHVFKPHEVLVKDEGQRMKINELLDKIKLVQEGKASAKDVRKVADDLLATTKTLKDGPDPLSLEELIRIYNEDVKNEVKRQQSSEGTVPSTTSDEGALTNTTTSPTESVNVTSTATTTTTAMPVTSNSTRDDSSSRNTTTPAPESSASASSNLEALEESFGGSTRAPDPVLPTKRRNGLYFLVDWNTFLEVGEEDSEKVNLRFQPKVGDRSRFLPVNVP
ncbi:hypothetical protein PUN28_006269 [Cardiocondyla obscurior]|uniref:Uncharacterized protein n=1 Tax=Cardiocondyla obscurior TaxID=286306 RepID=A0AAW2GAQ4_9HYME